jgi:penicillin-binding protein 1A
MADKTLRKDKKIQRDEYFNNKEYRRSMMKKKKRKSSYFWRVVIVALVILIAVTGMFTAFLFKDLPSLSALENPKTDIASRIYSEDGELIDQFYIQNRTIVSIDAIPKTLSMRLLQRKTENFINTGALTLTVF